MTIRDIVKMKEPYRVHDICAGGVCGCPSNYAYLQGYKECCEVRKKGADRFDYCDECWSQLYIEGIQQQQ